ncbi:MAG: aminotransferase class I/II-fold pyridoxal phosphate-dependent enzyme [Anaerolineales bacterium]|nr:MAG: aminotransferase class I/II-fold pyridoxal phosphate-dependent enzyme [Anaerolineales bacterium]
MISHLARAISPSPTFALNEKARILREKGEPVINMGIGEPKNKAPITAILSSAAKLTSGDIKYTPPDGTPGLKKAIIRYTEENYDKLVSPENVLVTAGAKQSIFNILFSVVNPQDEVIILAPYWVSYTEMIKMVNGVPVVITPEDGTFHPRMSDIEQAVTSYTKAIIVNSPNNPSGIIFSETFIAEIVEFCERKRIYLVMDDIYHKLVFNGHQVTSAYKYSNQDLESSMIIVVNGVSKLYGMTGFRIGWVIASRKLIDVMLNVQAQTTSCTSVVLQSAAEGALLGMQSIVENLRLSIENNRNIIMQELKSFHGLKVIEPQGTFYCLPDFRNYCPSAIAQNTVELAKFILEKTLVVTVPGKEFGMEGHLRLSYAGSTKEIIEGIERIKWAIDPSSPNEIYIGDRKLVRDWL